MVSELERRIRENSTLSGRLQSTRDKSKVLRGGGAANINSAASRLAKQSGGLNRSRRAPQGFSSPSAEWNASGGQERLAREATMRTLAQQPRQFLFADAPSLDQFLAQAASNSGAEQFGARIKDAERRKEEALRAIQFGAEDLARNIESSRGTVDAGYSDAVDKTQQSLQQTQQAMAAQQAATQQAQEAQWAALGLDSRPDTNASSDAAFAQTILASQNGAAQDALRANQASQNSLNTAYVNAARGRGQEDQNTARRTYDSAIAELLDAQASARAQAQQQAQSQYQQARSNWANDRDFAYNEWVRGQENDRSDARWLLEQQLAAQANQPEVELSPYQRYMQSQSMAGVTPGTAGRWANQASIGARNKAPMEQWIGGGSPEARSNILEYLKSVGLI